MATKSKNLDQIKTTKLDIYALLLNPFSSYRRQAVSCPIFHTTLSVARQKVSKLETILEIIIYKKKKKERRRTPSRHFVKGSGLSSKLSKALCKDPPDPTNEKKTCDTMLHRKTETFVD